MCALLTLSLHAHDLARSESVVTVRGSEVRVRLMIDALVVAGADANGNGDVTLAELDEKIDRLYTIVKDHFTIRSASLPTRTTLERYIVRDGHVAELDLLYAFDADVSSLTMTSTFHRVMPPQHEHVTRVSFGDGKPRQAVLDGRMTEATFSNTAEPRSAGLILGLLGASVVACAILYQVVRRMSRRSVAS